MANKKEKGSWVIPIIGILILLFSFMPAALVTYLYYRDYKKLPDASGKGLALFYAIISCIPIYIVGAIIFPIFYSKVMGGSYVAGDSWLICALLVICITLPAWFAYLYQITKTKGVSDEAESYIAALDAVLRNKKFDNEESEQLKNLSEKYRISAGTLNEIHKDAFISTLFNCATDDFEVNPAEKKFLKRMADYMNIEQDVLDYADQIIEQTKAIKKIIDGKEQGIITTVFMPKKDERCVMLEDCTLYENIKKGFYIGGSVGLKNLLPLGELFNPRFYLGKRVDYEKMGKVDDGKIALSTKRIVFIGDNITRSIDFDDIIGLDIGPDCFQINRQGKAKKEVFKMNSDTVKLLIGALFQVKG